MDFHFLLQFHSAWIILSCFGQCECVVGKKDDHISPCSADDGMQNGSSALLPHSKIKVQLYPVDERTRIGLEKVIGS